MKRRVRDMAHDTGEFRSEETDSLRHGAGKRAKATTEYESPKR